jgi:O-antigen/teichoic acid export membrane protein
MSSTLIAARCFKVTMLCFLALMAIAFIDLFVTTIFFGPERSEIGAVITLALSGVACFFSFAGWNHLSLRAIHEQEMTALLNTPQRPIRT